MKIGLLREGKIPIDRRVPVTPQQVIEIESTPDSGVEIKKAVVAPLFAPCFFNDAAAGRTPQEQSGIGIPNNAALKTELYRPLPSWLATYSGDKNIFKTPPTSIPNKIYGEASRKRCQEAFSESAIYNTTVSMVTSVTIKSKLKRLGGNSQPVTIQPTNPHIS